jgi:outer membrane protein OmpA-like peptidoglycan-associated protein
MASKKYSYLAGALCLLASYAFSQQPTTTTTTTTTVTRYDVADSSVIASKNLPQYTEFMNGTYNFPAKPRSMTEIGIKVGSATIFGDVPGKFPTPGFGVHVRHALGHVVSLRLEYVYGMPKGQQWKPSSNYQNNTAWTSNGYSTRTDPRIFYNYKSTVQDLALEGIFALNNINFYKAQNKVSVYGLVGFGGLMYNTKVNALNGSAKYNFSSIPTPTRDNKGDVKTALKNLMDDSYETQAEVDPFRKTLGDNTFRFVGHFGGGIAFRLSPRMNLAFEDRYTVTKDDLMDGQRWAEQVSGQPVLTSDYDSYNFASVGLNFNIGSKAVEPLWWVNPLEYAYQEIRKPRLMILPKPTLPDTDGDGVTDQFDQEVTPAGCPVDSHGVSLDTDGDGVPDCRDKQKITPTECQPVDADGVGKCPEPECCKNIQPAATCATSLGSLPSIAFSGNTTTVTSDAQGMLASVAGRLRNNPNCRITVVGYCVSPKATQTRGVARVDAVVNYLVEKEGISRDRITTLYGQQGGDCGTVDLRAE